MSSGGSPSSLGEDLLSSSTLLFGSAASDGGAFPSFFWCGAAFSQATCKPVSLRLKCLERPYNLWGLRTVVPSHSAVDAKTCGVSYCLNVVPDGLILMPTLSPAGFVCFAQERAA